MNKIILILFAAVILSSCKHPASDEKIVYSNDFESSNLTGITNGLINQFNSNSVLGQYNNSNFTLSVNNLPKHQLVTIFFDLYIHDSWDGNKPAPNGPDIWKMVVDGDTFIEASFSNEPCIPTPGVFCSPQSYPLNYPNNNNGSRKEAARIDLPGACSLKNDPSGSTMYKIEKTFNHTNSNLLLQCLDKLIQSNTNDPKCDESWSVDNIRIKVITL